MTEAAVWIDAMTAASLFAADPEGLGGIAVRAQVGPVRDRFVAALPGPMRRMPACIADEALLGGLDIGATLSAGRPVRTRGLLEGARGATLVAAMAERMPGALAARVTAAMDDGGGFGVVALDEGIGEERAPAGLLDRLAFHVDLSSLGHRDAPPVSPPTVGAVGAVVDAREVTAGAAVIEALCHTALALGIASPRAAVMALRAARAAAALAGRREAAPEDAAMAARLVLAPRATVVPDAASEASAEAPTPEPDGAAQEGAPETMPAELAEMVVRAACAAIPAGLLARLRTRPAPASRVQGKSGARRKGQGRGRPVGVRAADPAPGLRLNLIETLRAAAPWQRLRAASGGTALIKLRREDFRVTRTEQRARSTTIFLVDASGSLAINRLAEAKGAVELLLADCYRRRDEVAVLAFRGRGVLPLLPPTRSLVRARRCLAGLPGGGGTPMAAALEAGCALAATVRRAGATPALVLLTDGRANVTQAGLSGRAEAERDALEAARRLRAAGFAALLLDTAPRPGREAARLADAMGAHYVPMPYAGAAGVSAAVRAVLPRA